jgi:hypothetical protein
MKTLLFSLIIISSFTIFSQENSSNYKNDSIQYSQEETWIKHTPGQEFILASSKYYTGLSLQVIGGLLFGIGSISDNIDYKTTNNLCKIIGGGLSITGIAIQVSSFKHIERAGILLDRKNIR